MEELKFNKAQNISAYIHIPFCEHICYYCDFNKVFIAGQPVDQYIEAVIQEIQLMLKQFPTEKTNTIYIGGGTPTSLSAKQLDRLLTGLKILPYDKGEFTVEANPGDLTEDKLKVLKEHGVNRISMGVQTFDNRLLKKIGRKHTAEDVYQSIALLEKMAFENITIDLIYALPGQSLASFRSSVEQALELDLPHYALYSLILENKTMFMNWVRRGKLQLPEEELEAQMYLEVMEAMEKAGKKQYEVSNFAQSGFESQHNQVYWDNQYYYGIGAGASGYLGNLRYKNHGPIQHYLRPLAENKLAMVQQEFLTIDNQIEEELFLGLRKIKGVSKAAFKTKFNQELKELYGPVIEALVTEGLMIEDRQKIALTRAGLFKGNDVFEKFLLSK